jgi:hypothetical protein
MERWRLRGAAGVGNVRMRAGFFGFQLFNRSVAWFNPTVRDE